MQSQRQFEMIYLLLQRGQMTARALAQHFEVSVRTIYRDLDALSLAGVPVYATKGRQGGIALMEGYVLDRALLTEEDRRELLSVMSAMQAARAPGAEQVWKKMETLLAQAPQRWVEIDLSSWGDGRARHLELLKQAILHKRKVQFDYWNRASQITHRQVQPLILNFQERAWYLKAFCELRQDYRLFKVSRMLHLREVDETFSRVYRAEEFYAAKSPQAPPMVKLELWMDASLAYRVLDEFAPQNVLRSADGSFLVTVVYPEDEWVYTYLMSFGHQVRILSPQRVRDIVRRRHEKALESIKDDTQMSTMMGYNVLTNTKEEPQMENQVFCQSCTMPMEKPEDFGTEKDGSQSADYCQYCYQNGSFTNPDETLEQMIETCVPFMVEAGTAKDADEARAQMNAFFPQLKRWAK